MLDAPRALPPQVVNVPNLVTAARLVLAVVLFVLMALERFPESLAVFLVTAGTDWVDGYWARRYGQVTQLGRILDPFADKLVICGAFVFLAGGPEVVITHERASGVPPWVAVVILGRELAVTGLRSFVEAAGGDFSAKWVGKWKMLLQCLVVALSLLRLCLFDVATRTWTTELPEGMHSNLDRALQASIAAALVLTVYSGVQYAWIAGRMFRQSPPPPPAVA